MKENSKPEAVVVQMSADEWRKTHRDFKSQINGQKYVLRATAAGTALVPVAINKEPKK
jgi:hypothetical protein